MSHDSYKELAIRLLEKMANVEFAKDLFCEFSQSSIKRAYKNPKNAHALQIRAIIENAGLDVDEVGALIEDAVKEKQYEFAAALREIAADLFPAAEYKHRAVIDAENRARQGRMGGSSPAQ